MSSLNITISRVPVQKILHLRHKMLRAGLPPETAHFDGDSNATTTHWAAFRMANVVGAKVEVVACLSLMLNSYNGEPAWQLRGMAVDEACQGSGLGRQLLTRAEEFVAAEGKAGWLWCNARTPAAGFYQKQGWTIVSGVFEVPTAGPHVKMSKKIKTPNLRETIEKRRSPR